MEDINKGLVGKTLEYVTQVLKDHSFESMHCPHCLCTNSVREQSIFELNLSWLLAGIASLIDEKIAKHEIESGNHDQSNSSLTKNPPRGISTHLQNESKLQNHLGKVTRDWHENLDVDDSCSYIFDRD